VMWSIPSGRVPQPKIVNAVQSSLIYSIKHRIVAALDNESPFLYFLVLFNSTLQVYDFTRNSWKVVCDAEDFCLPAPSGSLL
jgi:hypothetical protein